MAAVFAGAARTPISTLIMVGEAVIVKLVNPGIRETLRRDVVLLRLLGFCLQTFLSRL